LDDPTASIYRVQEAEEAATKLQDITLQKYVILIFTIVITSKFHLCNFMWTSGLKLTHCPALEALELTMPKIDQCNKLYDDN